MGDMERDHWGSPLTQTESPGSLSTVICLSDDGAGEALLTAAHIRKRKTSVKYQLYDPTSDGVCLLPSTVPGL